MACGDRAYGGSNWVCKLERTQYAFRVVACALNPHHSSRSGPGLCAACQPVRRSEVCAELVEPTPCSLFRRSLGVIVHRIVAAIRDSHRRVGGESSGFCF